MHSWINQLKGKPIGKESGSTPRDVATLIEENRRLHKELSVVKEEKEILKKRRHTLLYTKSKVCLYQK